MITWWCARCRIVVNECAGRAAVVRCHLAPTSRVIAVCDTSACTSSLKLHAEVSQTAIMKTVTTAGGRHWEHRHGRHGNPLGVRRGSPARPIFAAQPRPSTPGPRQVHVVQSRVAFGDGTGPAGSVGRAESALRSGGGEMWAARGSQ